MFLFFSCKKAENKYYPYVIKKYNLEEQFDLAKWEIYKLNCVIENKKYDSDIVAHFEGEKQEKEFRKAQDE